MDTSPRQEAALEGKQGGRSAGLGGVLSLLRPHQWAKNVLVAVPLVTSHQFSSATAITTLVAAVSFSLAASAGYVINDLADREFDRRHPQKARRPLASGLVSVGAAVALAAGLAIGGGALSVVLLPASFPWALLLYVLLSLSYSAVFKRVPIVDVLVLAAMYTLRIFAGALAIGVSVSSWLLAFSMFLFLSLAFLKRYNELRALSTDDGVPSQESLAGRSYRRSDLEMFLAVGPASGYLAVLVLALYIESPQVVSLYSNQQALWLLCPLLLYWVTRLWFLVHRRGIHHDPVAFALKDPASWGVAILSALVLWAGIRL